MTPLLKSGGFKLRTLVPEVSGNTVTLSDGGELEGYETAFYAVSPHPKGGGRISFASAEVTKKGVSVPQPRPVLATRDASALDRLAAEIQANPSACAAAGGALRMAPRVRL